jgi:hypothetical protein
MASGDSSDKKANAAGGKAWLCGVGCDAAKWAQNYPAVVVAIVTAAVIESLLLYLFWPIKRMGGDDHLRNFILASAAISGFPFLVWRAVAFSRQVAAAQNQEETDSQRRLTEVYAKSAEMFASDLLSVRLAGLYGLWDLARENPDIYHLRVMDVICAFIRNPLALKDWVSNQGNVPAKRPDVSAAILRLCQRNKKQIACEQKEDYYLDFTYANLQGEHFTGGNFRRADFRGANLNGAYFRGSADLTGSFFIAANLQCAIFGEGTKLISAHFQGANLISAKISHSKSSQYSLSEAAINGIQILNPTPENVTGAFILVNDSDFAVAPGKPRFFKEEKFRAVIAGMYERDWEGFQKLWRSCYQPQTSPAWGTYSRVPPKDIK